MRPEAPLASPDFGLELAPGLDRWSLRVWLNPMRGIPIVPESVTKFLETTAQKCDAFVFAGPVCVAGDEVVGLDQVLKHKEYKPRDV